MGTQRNRSDLYCIRITVFETFSRRTFFIYSMGVFFGSSTIRSVFLLLHPPFFVHLMTLSFI